MLIIVGLIAAVVILTCVFWNSVEKDLQDYQPWKMQVTEREEDTL